MSCFRISIFFAVLIAMSAVGCETSEDESFDPGPNPFLETDVGEGKEDTAYVNLRGREVEVTIEADLEATTWRFFDGPAELAQYAVTYLRKHEDIFLEILAEDADAQDRVLWLVDGEWVSREEAAAVGTENLRRFRIPDVNVVLMNDQAQEAEVGDVFEATVPVRPFDTMGEAGDTCTDYNSHIDLDQSVYWYLWNPTKSGCEVERQQMTLTVEELFPENPETYPEYDQLLADGRLEAAVFFAKLDDGDVADDFNWQNVEALSRFLLEAGFEEIADPPMGRRFERVVNEELTFMVDIYGPDIFHSVADYTRFNNWERGVREHEVIMYNGHSVLGTGMAFEEVDYPEHYQIFQVASCLSYEYYVRPILAGKGGWESVDVLSNVEPTYYSENLPLTSTILARLFFGAENGGMASWQDIMEAVSSRLYHAHFGVSGARDNCYTPTGNRCEEEPPPPVGDDIRVESTEQVAIPDNDTTGVTSNVTVEQSVTIGAMKVELDITHTYIGDLTITLSHGGTTATIWNRSGASMDDIHTTIDVSEFNGTGASGEWSLHIVDGAGSDVGTLDAWALLISPAE